MTVPSCASASTTLYRISILILSMLAAAGCSGGGENESVEHPDDEAQPAVMTMGTSWALVQLDESGTLGPPIPDTAIELNFGADGKIDGHGGCNGFFGSYQLGNDSGLSIEGIGSTRMACPEPIMDQEGRFFALLESAASYHLERGRLLLRSAEGTTLLEFEHRN